jgi:anaerobic ribonucleoside-triphosphate reductase activating protein
VKYMRLIKTYHADLLNGEGLREVLFFSGCENGCPGCFNPETRDPVMPDSHEFGDSDWEGLRKELEKSWISGVTFSGGDPMSPWNRDGILGLARRIKSECPGKTVWCYTGYTWENILAATDSRTRALEYIDVLLEGPFIESRKSPKKLWVGSDNQRVIDVKESLRTGKIVLYS